MSKTLPQYLICRCRDDLPLLADPEVKDILLQSLNHLVDTGRVVVLEFSVLDNHVRLIWFLKSGGNYNELRRDFLKYTAKLLWSYLRKTGSPWLKLLKVDLADREFSLWKRSSHKSPIRNQGTLLLKSETVALSVVRAGLCASPEEYPYCSAYAGKHHFSFLNKENIKVSEIFESSGNSELICDVQYDSAKSRFIEAWGLLGANWGINRAMARLHALLLISPEPLSADEIMTELNMSRGNVNMNLRALIDWGIVKRETRAGERKEYFSTGKEVPELARQVARERRRREIEPVLQVLKEIQNVQGDNRKNIQEFKKVTSDLLEFTSKVDSLVDTFSKSEKSWFYKLLMKL